MLLPLLPLFVVSVGKVSMLLPLLPLFVVTIELHRIEMTALSQRTAPGVHSRRVPL